MDRLRAISQVIFLTVSVAAGLAGYRYQGWLGAVVYPIAALALLGFALVGALIVSVWMKYLRDRARISHLSVEQLRLIVARPHNAEFRFAFAELAVRGIDMKNVERSLIAMLVSNDGWERRLGLERLRSIYPELRPLHESNEVSPEHFQARVQSIIERNRQGER